MIYHLNKLIAHKTPGLLRHFSISLSNFNDNKLASDVYDIVISGGGLAGTAMAAALGHSPLFQNSRILLLESNKPAFYEKLSDKYSSRVCALSLATKNLFSSFGAWENIKRLQEVKHMRVWDSCSDVSISFNQLTDLPELAYIVENDVMLFALTKQLEKTKNVEIKYLTKVDRYNLSKANQNNDINDGSNFLDNTLHKIELVSGETIKARLIIGADGVQSLLKNTADIYTINWQYNQNAVVATVKINEDHENVTAWQRFIPTGPIALLPLSKEYSCLIWTTSKTHSKELFEASHESFIDKINDAYISTNDINELASYTATFTESIITATSLGNESIKQLPPQIIDFIPESRLSFPLGLGNATHYVKNRLVLIGDAAHRVHPLSGQGVNLGFGDVACLLRVLENTVQEGGDIGSLINLTAYETERQRKILPMMATIDILNKLYSNSFAPFVLLRSIGCQIVDSIPLIKERMIRFAIS